MCRILPAVIFLLIVTQLIPVQGRSGIPAAGGSGGLSGAITALQDTTGQDSIPAGSLEDFIALPGGPGEAVVVPPAELSLFPAVSLQQFLKGQAPGLYVQEPSGEPGTLQPFFMRGTPMPLLSARDVYQAQPLVVLDGIPLIGEHPFAFDIQQYDYNRIGPATNLLANIDMDHIEKVEVLSDLAGTAVYGPQGANGVIALTTRKAGTERRIHFNSYVGISQRPEVTTINGDYENAFRRQFYDRYTAAGRYSEDDVYPLYLSDSLNNAYYGPSNWTDSYYRNGVVHSVNASISGGTERANFRFAVGNMSNQGIADETGLNRYSAMFGINMKPMEWLLFSAMVNGNRLERVRNRNLRDRFAQMGYMPDLGAPLAPNKETYDRYLGQFGNSFDDNKTNVLEGYARLAFDLGRVKFATRLSVDYNEGYRDLFYPRTLMEDNSYASNYYGFNQRLVLDNVLTYTHPFGSAHDLSLEAGQSIQWDTYKYNYAYAYKGVNDFIKINLLESDPDKDNYLLPLAFPRELVYKFLDRTQQNLMAFYGKISYDYAGKYSATLLLRGDGSSNAQPTERWLFTPVLSLGWDMKSDLLAENPVVSALDFRLSAGRSGRLNVYDNFSQGPQYTAEIGFTGNPVAPGYNGFAILSRPYSFGWVGYGIPWAYTDQLNAGMEAGFLEGRFRLRAGWYLKQDKNQLLGIPSYAEYGYSQSYEPGMDVENTGVDLMLSAGILQPVRKDVSWAASFHINLNRNRLKALPRGLDELVLGDRLLQVGKAVDQYWLLTNDGIYTSDAEVPVVNGETMTYNGITLRAGDPKWRDLNGDNRIDDNDKTLMGHILPGASGGFINDLRYRNWSLNLHLYFNLGRQLVNREMAGRFDFINREGTSDMDAVKEITYWEKRGDYSQYPLYNPWSSVIPYRADQDLFLEDASFLKLRSVSLGYDLSAWLGRRSSKIERIFIYASASNLFTLTPYTGRDPELVNYTGYDNGYGMYIPRTYTVGVKMDL